MPRLGLQKPLACRLCALRHYTGQIDREINTCMRVTLLNLMIKSVKRKTTMLGRSTLFFNYLFLPSDNHYQV